MNNKLVKFIFCLLVGWGGLTLPALAMDTSAGVILADDQGNILYAQNPDKFYTPASILKIFTSLAAQDYFGIHHRFKTLFAYDRRSQNLYIKGFGDPLFVSEVIQALCEQIITRTKAKTIQNIILDHSFFHPDIEIPGTGNSLNPYDATSGALCANFNTLSFKWDSAQKTYASAEPQTPLLPDFLEEINASGQHQGRILLAPKQRKTYPGLLIKFFLSRAGVPVKGAVRQGYFERPQEQTVVFESPFTLGQVLQKLLKYSNNFVANQLILAMGADKQGPPATLAKGVNMLKAFGREKLGLSHLIIEEGSGISRANKISPRQMLQILLAFMPLHDLLNTKETEYYKTGTLSDVRCRAGFVRGKNRRLYPFVIMVHGRGKRVDAIRLDLLGRVRSGSP